MAVVLGTNAGFVTVAPSADPAGTTTTVDAYAKSVKDTSPATAGKITEVGWWCDNATEETNFEVGLYEHDAVNDLPKARLFVSATNAKGTDAGWKKATVDWSISPNTIYWIAIQVDNTTTATNIDRNTDATRVAYRSSSTTLPDPWINSVDTVWARAIYAVWEEGSSYSELSGTCEATGSGSGNLELKTYSELSGTCAGVGGGNAEMGSVAVHASEYVTYKRLISAGNNQIWYEAI